ncbi:MAG: glycosyltransferase family 2 protein [Alphaproteobacteria bacterium]|nr:glycosyltransferase family 2 protein [Alphaproteobacteria bacterium]
MQGARPANLALRLAGFRGVENNSIRYSIVIPFFNERAVLPALLERLDDVISRLDAPSEVIFVDDGSRDGSAEIIRSHAVHRPAYKVIELSRNFGHQVAITAGMDHASGEAVIIMDADLQDPPELVLEMIEKWAEGYDIVCAQRVAREDDTWFKRSTAWFFYRALSLLTPVEVPPDVGDFRLVDRSVVDSFTNMRERDRFVRGMFAWMGYRQITIPFSRPDRFAGETKYPLRKMFALAMNGILGFSDVPLRLVIWFGMIVSVMAVFCGIYAIVLRFSNDDLVPGWASTIVVVAFLAGANMLMTGIVGLYIGRIHREVKGRPLYLVRSAFGFQPELLRRPAQGGEANLAVRQPR